MGPEIRNIDRLIDDEVERAEASVTYVPEGYGGIVYTKSKRDRQDEEDDED